MSSLPNHDFIAIVDRERRDLDSVHKATFAERGEMLTAVCRDAAAIEASRLQMGFPSSQPAPWPDSTWKFLAEAARRVRQD
jgi:hypothetical protein